MTVSDLRLRRTGARVVLVMAAAGLLLAVGLFATGLFLWASGRAGSAVGGPFRLVDQSGRVVTDASFRGRYMLVYFGYTYCPDICPTTLTEVGAALDRLGKKADRIVPVFITVDPARDTPAALRTYVGAFSPRLVGLTGTAQEIGAAEGAYHVYSAKHVTGPGPNDYAMDHSSFLYLMGPDGRFVAPIQSGGSAEELADRLDRLVP